MNDDEKSIRELLQAAGPRPAIAAEDADAIKRAAREAWRARYGRSPWKSRWLIPLAALFILGFAVAWWIASREDDRRPPLVVAHVERVSGIASLAARQPLVAGTVLETAEGNVALRMPGLQSLRLDVHTQIRLISPKLVQLERGAVYLDSGHRGSVTVRTFAGDIQPNGTQFEVRVDGARLRVRVREGRVAIGPRLHAGAGDEILIERGAITRDRIRADDPAWEWASALVPMPEIEGRSVGTFLDWIAREKGWRLRFASTEAESRAHTTMMHGSVRELTPLDALSTVMLSAGMEYRLVSGELIVDLP